ncbi:MAG: LapA family protein [Proteobacteria bacterium]|nr:LapA family protein [Pseudomonadota bacterium]
MAKVFYWIIVVPLAALVIIFSINNRTEVRLDFWPLGAVPLPVYLIVLVCLVVGFFVGGMVAWRSAGGSRSRARTQARRADQAERELATAQDRIDRLLSEAEKTADDILKLPPAA